MSRTFLLDFYIKSPVTFVLAFMVLIVSCVSLFNKKLFLQFILHPVSVVRDRQYYRVLTADLANADLMHLLLNEFMLYVFCSDLEETLRRQSRWGSLQFAAIYWGSLLFASAIVTFRHYKEFGYSTTGTSGSILGCMFAFMVIAPDFEVYQLPGLGVVKNIYGGLAFILMLIIYQRKRKNENVNHELHFFGAIGGLIVVFLLRAVG